MAKAFSKRFRNISYLPSDRTPYTGTDNESQLIAGYLPDGRPEDYGFSGGFPYIHYCLNSGFTVSGPKNAVDATELAIQASDGLFWQFPMRGIALVFSTGTSANPAGAVAGRGMFHAFGGVDRRGETNANAFVDYMLASQYLQMFGPSLDLNPDAWIASGDSGGAHIAAMVGLAPNLAGTLGTGGQYGMNTVPNACLLLKAVVLDPAAYIQTVGGGGPPAAFYPPAETGAPAVTAAGDYNLAVARYLDESKIWSIFQKGSPRHETMPPTLGVSSVPTVMNRFAEPFQTGQIHGGNLVHDSWNLITLRENARGRMQMYLSTAAAAVASVAGKYDGIIDDYNAQGVAESYLESDPLNIIINWACRAVKTPKWNVGRFPSGGISRRGQVETTGAVRVPGNPWRGGVLVENTGDTNDLLVGPDRSGAVKRASPTSSSRRGEIWVPGTDSVWLKSAAGVTSFAAREVSKKEAALRG